MSKKFTLTDIERVSNERAQHVSQPSATNPSLRAKRNSLIAQLEDPDQLEDDSNDEWEENVELDQSQVRATIASVLANQQSQSSQKLLSSNQSDADHSPSIRNGPGSNQPDDDPVSKDELKALERRRAILQRKRRLRRHTLHLTLLIGHLLRLDATANDQLVQALALSVAPTDFLTHTTVLQERLSRLALWFRATFRTTAMPVNFDFSDLKKLPKFRLNCDPLRRVITPFSSPSAIVDIFDLCAAFCALLRQQHIRCRLVSPLQPIPYQPQKLIRTSSSSADTEQIVQKGPVSSTNDSVMFAWVEVWSSGEERWIAVDVFDGHICASKPSSDLVTSIRQIPPYKLENSTNSDNQYENTDLSDPQPRRRSNRKRNRTNSETIDKRQIHRHDLAASFFCHVVAVENGMVTDVTRRYMRSWPDVRQGRAVGDAFSKCVEAMGREPISPEELDVLRSEMKEFEKLLENDPIPTTLSMIQKHPRYVLERHVKKYEVVHPKEPIVGFLNNEPVYLRENVHILHTKDRWIRQMREVVEGEKALKNVKSKNGTDSTVELFGKWQTKPLKIESVVDGKVPRGAHGNVDLWTEEHLPSGGTHVNLTFAKQAARKLGVDFAPAMTGFELRRGRSVPRIEGVVVASENADAVRDAAKELEQIAREREDHRLRMAAEEQWNRLLRKMQAREKVRSKYGNPELALSYEARQKRAGERIARLEKRGERGVEKSRRTEKEAGTAGEGAAVKAHTHTFGEEKCVEGILWVKKCSVCATEVPFEKL